MIEIISGTVMLTVLLLICKYRKVVNTWYYDVLEKIYDSKIDSEFKETKPFSTFDYIVFFFLIIMLLFFILVGLSDIYPEIISLELVEGCSSLFFGACLLLIFLPYLIINRNKALDYQLKLEKFMLKKEVGTFQKIVHTLSIKLLIPGLLFLISIGLIESGWEALQNQVCK